MSEEARSVCSKHPGEGLFYLEELPDNDAPVRCPECGEEWQNFIKYPEALVHDFSTGETFMKNVLTGERVS